MACPVSWRLSSGALIKFIIVFLLTADQILARGNIPLNPVVSASASLEDDTSNVHHQIPHGDYDCNGDLIQQLPGAPPHSFKQYAGYVTVDRDHGRRLFYWFVEAASEPDQKPLTLWLNGGPGCSSIAGGAMSELGPFFPSRDGQSLIENEFSWNLESNILFLESPAGVGFSYSETTSDYSTGDLQTAEDSRAFLLGWFAKFPHYKNRPFYLSGESYAGHYIPDLAQLLWAQREEDKGVINLQGFLLGNPWTVTSSDFKGMVDFWWFRTLISHQTYRDFQDQCTPLDYQEEEAAKRCYLITSKAMEEMGDLNPYDVYVDVCSTGPLGEAQRLLTQRGLNLSQLEPSKGGNHTALRSSSYDPCIDNEVETYLNLPAVQEAIHAARLPYRWIGCSDILRYSLSDSVESKLALWKELLRTPLRMTVFSGDVDSVCPTLGTRDWIEKLEADGHLALSKEWYPWYLHSQVGGYTEEYNNGQFKFVTVRNAGHMVPYMQPARGLALFREFIHGHSMPREHLLEQPNVLSSIASEAFSTSI